MASQEGKRDVTFRMHSGEHCLQGARPTMEDQSIVWEGFHVEGSTHGPLSLYGIFDGHGGAMAARFVKDNIQRVLTDQLTQHAELGEAMRNCYLRLDDEFLKSTGRDSSGTTAVCALVQHNTNRLWVANAGDSRCVLSSGDAAVAMTSDHKPERPDETERIRKAGGFVMHKRVMGGLAVSRAIGDCDFKSEGQMLVIAEPDVKEHHITQADAYLLLACDGLFDVMQNDAACRFIKREFKNGKSSAQAACAIGTHAVKNLHSQDNVSVLIVRFEHCSSSSPHSEPSAAATGSANANNPHTHSSSSSTALPAPSHSASRTATASDSVSNNISSLLSSDSKNEKPLHVIL